MLLSLAYMAEVRVLVFVLSLGVLLVLQALLPRRALPTARWRSMLENLTLVGLGNVLLRLVLPLGLAAAASLPLAQAGLFHQLGLEGVLGAVAGLVVMDLAIYWQHRVFHLSPWLWRLHRVHHSDKGFETTTAVRFHPFELLLSGLIKLGLIMALGLSAWTVVIFEILLSSCALFNHANLRLPAWLDARLRLVLVTPDMHRVHHSRLIDEHNRNYGFCFSLWDRLFGSYTAQPRDGHRGMRLGLDYHPATGLKNLLLLPFVPLRGKAG